MRKNSARFECDDDIIQAVRARIVYGFNQTQLADELGVSRSHLCEFLAGKKGAGPVLLKALGYDPVPHYRKSP